ncbi:MAG: hypothetical protein HWN81_03800 [Candidatus Lokiarchaeota archaeon]|nr:hypothetical protein [Candidatus Lokiarchaeota archaeon]
MSTPVSIHDGPFTTNTLASKSFLIIYVTIIWGSILPLLLELYLFLKLIEYDFYLFILLLPFQIYIGYIILVFSSILLAKVFLIIINLIHKPKEGIFERNNNNKDYYFWSLRAIIKKWPVWISKFIPLPLVDKLNVRWFHNDSEFIEYGKNVCIGKGSSIRASMIFREFLIIKKVKIEDNVTIGSNSYIVPGTHIYKNTTITMMSVTKFNQKIKRDSDSKKYSIDSIQEINNVLSKVINLNDNLLPDKPKAEKFVKNLNFDLFTFGALYFFSNLIPILGSIYFVNTLFFPVFLQCSSFFSIFQNINSLVIFFVTPLFLIIVYFMNLLIVIFFTKLLYKFIQYLNPVKEGVFHWENKNNDYKCYFKRSFILRYVKWKIQKSPFPWLIKFAFNFIGNCQIGTNTVIEDSYLAKELLKVGNNTYLGKALIANHLWDKSLTVKKITIGDNVTISDNCCISPGTEIQENVSLLPLSVTTKNDNLSADSIYFNSPLTKISKERLINIFNLDMDDLALNKIKLITNKTRDKF